MPPRSSLHRRVRQALGTAVRPLAFVGAVAILKMLPARQPPHILLRLLNWGWGNRSYSADPSYLAWMGRLATEQGGAVLECGSGVSTLVLGLVTSKQGFPVFALEHDRAWHDRVTRTLRRHGLHNVQVHHAPLEDYGAYHWYAVDGLPLPDDVRLVVCDGPPGDTAGGRYGLLPVVGNCVAPGCLILLDDANRPGEQQVLDLWRRQFPVELLGFEGAKHALLKVTDEGARRSETLSP